MIKLKPFKAIRPPKELASKVAALPYDVLSSEEARILAKGNPHSFLRVNKAEIDGDEQVDLYDSEVYEKAKENLEALINEGILVKDKEENLYIYKQTMEGKEQVGLVGVLSVDDYLEKRIKEHEETIEEKEKDRTNHIRHLNANTGPIFLTYRSKDEISQVINHWMDNNNPVYDFITEDHIGHTVWVIHDETVIKNLVVLFQDLKELYVADGHHRAASAVTRAKERRVENLDYTGEESFNYFLSVIFPDKDLNVMDYNRVVQDLNGLSNKEFIAKVREKFIVEEREGKAPYRPMKKHEFGMLLGKTWYKLQAKEGSFNAKDPVESLDVSILQDHILEPILGIDNPRTNQRIDFIGGIRGLEELEKRVKEGMAVAFSMYPTAMEDLMEISDEGKIMPPKSTWFEPKLRSGLFVHDLE